MRPDIHTYFMNIALQAATRSTCKRRNVGAALVRDGHIVSTGYNGSPPGLTHCTESGGCLRGESAENCIQTIHAELNALLHASTRQKGDVLYCTDQPCLSCLKAALGAGVERIIYMRSYPSSERELFVKYNDLQGYMVFINELIEKGA